MAKPRQKKRPSAPASPRREKPVPCDAVLFDIDNVLIDTRKSYLEAIRWTIQIYLTDGKIPLFGESGKEDSNDLILTEEDIHHFKLLGGFNDDWDCCYGLLVYLLSLPIKRRTLTDLRKAIDLPKFARKVKSRPLGVAGVTDMLERPNSVTIEKIGRIFQEVYLGKELFRAVEGKYPVYWKKKGLICKERLIFKRRILKRLTDAGIRLGIATGRPRFEALFALKHFDIADLFDAITTMDDIRCAERDKKQSLRKPHPYSLIQTAKRIGNDCNFLYIGDLPDDVLAANTAKEEIQIHSVAFPAYGGKNTGSMAEFERVKPDYVIRSPTELLKLLRI